MSNLSYGVFVVYSLTNLIPSFSEGGPGWILE